MAQHLAEVAEEIFNRACLVIRAGLSNDYEHLEPFLSAHAKAISGKDSTSSNLLE
jgi:hypothetical protein